MVISGEIPRKLGGWTGVPPSMETPIHDGGWEQKLGVVYLSILGIMGTYTEICFSFPVLPHSGIFSETMYGIASSTPRTNMLNMYGFPSNLIYKCLIFPGILLEHQNPCYPDHEFVHLVQVLIFNSFISFWNCGMIPIDVSILWDWYSLVVDITRG